MFYADLAQQGYHLLRHHSEDFDVKLRLVSFGCRIGGPDQGAGSGWDSLGQLQGVRTNWGGEETHGDILNWGMWPIETLGATGENGAARRTIPGWAQAWAVVVQPAPSESGITDGPTADAPISDGASGLNPFISDALQPLTFGANAGDFKDVANASGAGAQLVTLAGPSDRAGPGGSTVSRPPGSVGTTAGGGAPTTTGAPKLDVKPVLKEWLRDTRFQVKSLAPPPFVGALPAGVGGIVVTGTDEYGQRDLLAPILPNALFAPHFGGRSDFGAWVYDVTAKDEPDRERRAHLQTLVRVFEIGDPARPSAKLAGFCGPIGSHALAINMGPARGGVQGRAAFADVGSDYGVPPLEVIGLASHQAGGPLHPGSGNDKHQYSETHDRDRINSLHLSTKACFFRDVQFDAPLEFGDFYEPAQSTGVWWETRLRYDANRLHDHPLGKLPGLWRWETRVPFYVPPPPNGRRKPKTVGANETRSDPEDTFSDPNDSTDSDAIADSDPASGENVTDPMTDQPGGSTPDSDPGGPKNPADDDHRIKPPQEEGFSNPFTEHGITSRNTSDLSGYGDVPSDLIHDGTFPESMDHTLGPGTPTGDGGGGIDGPPSGPGDRPVGGGTFERPQVSGGPRNIFGPDPGGEITDGPRPDDGESTPLATLNEMQLPAISVRAQQRNIAAVNYLYNDDWGPSDSASVAGEWPVVCRMEGVGAETADGGWNLFDGPGAGDYGQCSGGGMWVMPPNVTANDIFDGTAPTDTPDVSLGLHQSSLSFGTPTTGGLTGDGFDIYLAGNSLLVDTTDAAGNVTSTDQLFPIPTPGSGGLTTGSDAGRPGTPATIGDTWVVTDKLNGPTTPSGSLDPSTAFGVGLLDAKTWGFVALINGWPQTVSSPWTFTGANVVGSSGSFATSGSGTIDANKLVTKVVSTSLTTNKPLVYNGTQFATSTLGIAGGGTGLTALAGTYTLLYTSAANTLAETAAPDARGGQALVSDPTLTLPGWSWDLGGGTQTGTDTNGTSRAISGMRGTGTGTGGTIDLKVALAAGSTGSTANALVRIVSLDGLGNFVTNARGSALATSATAGFTYLPSCAGTPTGALASSYTGAAAIVVDTTGSKLWYSTGGGTWTSLTGTGGGGGSDLATTLASGNVTGGTPIIVSDGDWIQGEDNASGDGKLLQIIGGAATAGSNHSAGGLNLDGGACTGTGNSQVFFRVSPGDFASSSSPVGSTTVAQINGHEQRRRSGSGDFWYVEPTFEDGGNSSTGTTRIFRINPIMAYSGSATGKYEAFVVDVTDTGSPTGSNLLAAFRVSGSDLVTINPAGQCAMVTQATVVAAVSTGTTAIDDTASVWPCDTTSPFTITLPDATTSSGRHYWIKKTSADVNALTIATTSSQKIDGSTTLSVTTQWTSLSLVSDGSNWLIL